MDLMQESESCLELCWGCMWWQSHWGIETHTHTHTQIHTHTPESPHFWLLHCLLHGEIEQVPHSLLDSEEHTHTHTHTHTLLLQQLQCKLICTSSSVQNPWLTEIWYRFICLSFSSLSLPLSLCSVQSCKYITSTRSYNEAGWSGESRLWSLIDFTY